MSSRSAQTLGLACASGASDGSGDADACAARGMRRTEVLRIEGASLLAGLGQRWHGVSRAPDLSAPLLLTRSRSRPAYRRILIGVDFSAPLGELVDAARIVVGNAAQWVLLAPLPIQDESDPRSDSTAALVRAHELARARLQSGAAGLSLPGLISLVVRRGTLDDVVHDYARCMRADLVVLRWRQTPAAQALLRGSVQWRLARRLDADLLLTAP